MSVYKCFTNVTVDTIIGGHVLLEILKRTFTQMEAHIITPIFLKFDGTCKIAF